MAKRKSGAADRSTAIVNSASLSALEQQVITIAEQLGRLAGTAQARADDWLDPQAFHLQLTRIRKRAAALVSRLDGHRSPPDPATQKNVRARSRAKVAAPGKKHRPRPEPVRGVKHSDERVTKSAAARRRRTARPRQG